MACCGQNRTAFAHQASTANRTVAPVNSATSLRFLQKRAILVRGPLTGRRYQFSPEAFTTNIDPGDMDALLKSGYFERMTD
jgi:hypothetical protein